MLFCFFKSDQFELFEDIPNNFSKSKAWFTYMIKRLWMSSYRNENYIRDAIYHELNRRLITKCVKKADSIGSLSDVSRENMCDSGYWIG